MDRVVCRLLLRSAVSLAASVIAVAACTRTTDRVVEPVGGGDASTTSPEVSDAGESPIGPIAPADTVEPAEDFRLVRAPEFGAVLDAHHDLLRFVGAGQPPLAIGGSGGNGTSGAGGNDTRPVASGGNELR